MLPEKLSDSHLFGLVFPGIIVLAAGSTVLIRAVYSRTDPWLLGDWLIDYSAGFSWRGLVGEIIRQVSGALEVDRIILTGVVIWAVFIALVAVVTLLFLRHRRGLTTLLLFVSPAFVFYFLNFLGTMRKELLLFLLVATVLLLTAVTRQGRWVWALSGLFPVLIFAHEGMALFGGFILIIVFLLHREGTLSRAAALTHSTVATVLSVIAGAVVLRWGSPAGIDERICQNLVGDGYSRRLCGGAIAFLDRDTGKLLTVSCPTSAPKTISPPTRWC